MIYKLFLVICRAQSYFFYFHFQNFYYQKKLTIAQKRAETVNKHSTKSQPHKLLSPVQRNGCWSI